MRAEYLAIVEAGFKLVVLITDEVYANASMHILIKGPIHPYII